MNENPQALKSTSRLGMLWGILTILLGFFAIGSPLYSGLAVAVMVGIALVAAGISMTLFAFQAPSLFSSASRCWLSPELRWRS